MALPDKESLNTSPHWIENFEEHTAKNISFHPNIISAVKKLIIKSNGQNNNIKVEGKQ
ncbi:hypothetical protein HY745_08865 [Candidatus Desantisbacteria bacterium]|nr:hypothetical protein [Candidatus Desantisbacteria bacterium]